MFILPLACVDVSPLLLHEQQLRLTHHHPLDESQSALMPPLGVMTTLYHVPHLVSLFAQQVLCHLEPSIAPDEANETCQGVEVSLKGYLWQEYETISNLALQTKQQ